MTDNWTADRVRELVAFARVDDPRWSWKLLLRPETAALLDLDVGEVHHPNPRYGPILTKEFEGCEVAVIDLLDDFVLASPSTPDGSPKVTDGAKTYWLDLPTGQVGVWTEDSLLEIKNRARDS